MCVYVHACASVCTRVQACLGVCDTPVTPEWRVPSPHHHHHHHARTCLPRAGGLGRHAALGTLCPHHPVGEGPSACSLPAAHQHPGSPGTPRTLQCHCPPSQTSPQPEVPVEGLRRRRGVQGVTPLAQRHGAVGPAAPRRCQRQRGGGPPPPPAQGTPPPTVPAGLTGAGRLQAAGPAASAEGARVASGQHGMVGAAGLPHRPQPLPQLLGALRGQGGRVAPRQPPTGALRWAPPAGRRVEVGMGDADRVPGTRGGGWHWGWCWAPGTSDSLMA